MRERTKMGRPREFDEDEALATIMDVFWKKGFEGATMSDLVTATGLIKGSLYAAFGDKRAGLKPAVITGLEVGGQRDRSTAWI